MKNTKKALLAVLTAGLLATAAFGIAACDDSTANQGGNNGGNNGATPPAPEEAVVYTVKFETNGGTLLPEQGANPGDKAVKPGDPKKAGYTFGGWYKDALCTVEYTFTEGVTGDTTVYAKWNAAPTTDAGYFRLTQDGEGWAVGAVPGKVMPTDVVIPSEIDGKKITSISESGFEDIENIASVTIPDSVTSIGQRAFRDCSGLEVVLGGANVEMIYSDAFDNTVWDNSLPAGEVYLGKTLYKYASSIFVETEIDVKAGTLGIASGAFLDQPNLVGITLPDGLKYIGSYAFGAETKESGSGVTELVIPDSVVEIGAGAFRYAAIETLVIGKSVAYIGNNAFLGANITSLEYKAASADIANATFDGMTAPAAVKISDEVTEFPENLVKGWDGIVSLDFGKGITVIPAGALEGHAMLEEVTFGDLVRIGNKAFMGTALREATLPATLTRLGDSAFANCTELTSVTVDAAEATVSGKTFPAFAGCAKLAEVKFTSSVRKIADYLFYGSAQLATVSFGQGLDTIGRYAFYGASIAGKLVLPNGLKKIGDHAFDAGADEDNLYFGVAPAARLQGIVVPLTLEDVGTMAFANNLALTYVAWNAENCKTSAYTAKNDAKPAVYESAFKGCKALSYVNVGASVKALPEQFIMGATKVEEVDVRSVPAIGANAFNGCTSLVSLGANNGSNIQDLGVDALKGTPWLANTMAAAAGKEYYIGKVLAGFSGTMNENYTLTVDSSKIVKIADEAFKGQKNLTKITLSRYGDALQSIGVSAFEGCTGLTTFSVASSKLKTIESRAFYGCTGLTTVTLTNVVTIGDEAFAKCSSLYKTGDFTIAKSIETIGAKAFDSMPLVGKLTAESGSVLREIGDEAFKAATPTEISLPESCERVGATWVSNNTKDKITAFSAPGLKYAGSLPFGGSPVEKDFDFSNIVEITGASVFSKWTRDTYEFPKLTKLGATAFGSTLNNKGIPYSYNTSVKKVIFGAEIEELPANAFAGCSAFEEIVLKYPEALKTIGENCFVLAGNPTADSKGSPIEGGTGFTIDVSHVTTFGESAFAKSYYKTKDLTLSEDLESMGNYAFQLCNDITGTLTIGGKIEEVPDRAFMNVPFSKIVVGGDIKSLGFRAFGIWSSEYRNGAEKSPNPYMTEVVIGEGVENIDGQAFVGRKGDVASLPSTLKTAGGYRTTGLGSGFTGFSVIKLNGFIEPSDIAENEPPFSAVAFFVCADDEIAAQIKASPVWDSYKNNVYGPADLTAEDWIIDAEGKILKYLGDKTNISIPAEAKSMANISAILGVTVADYQATKTIAAADDSGFKYENGMLLSKDGSALYYYNGSDAISSNTSVTEVKPYAFFGGKAASVKLDNASKIGSYAFRESNIATVTLPAATEVSSHAFFNAAGLTSVALGSSLKAVEDYTFNGCVALQSISLPKVTEVKQYAFKDCKALTSVDAPELVTVGNYAFQNCEKLSSFTFKNVETIGSSAFTYNALTTINLPKIKTIGMNAFQNHSALTSVTIGADCTSIGRNAFAGDTKNAEFNVTVNATTPPTGTNMFDTAAKFKGKIYVPSASVDTYKAASGWKTYANAISAISE